MKCCGKKPKVVDSRDRTKHGIRFRVRRNKCLVCGEEYRTREIGDKDFDRLLKLNESREKIKSNLSAVGELMRGL